MTVDDTLTTYRQHLVAALRLKDVPGDRIGEIVAEVESHVAETGEDPVDSFGTPRDYAASLTDEHRPAPWWQTLLTIASSAVAGFFLAQGVLALLLGESYLGQPGLLWVAVGLVIGIPAGINVWRRSSRVLDPRTGEDLVPTSGWGLATLVGLPVLIVLVAFGLIRLLG